MSTYKELYNQEEIERINKSKETNDKLEEFFSKKREDWNSNIEPLFSIMRQNFTLENSSKIMDVQANALSFRQKLNDEISYFLNRRSREQVKLKKITQDKFLFYATGFGLKTNTSEKTLLIEAHIAESHRTLEIIENHIEYLRACNKTIESLQFSIKNTIELMNYLGK